MNGKTHIAVGLALSTAVMQPQTIDQCFMAIIGGSLGGIISDIDLPTGVPNSMGYSLTICAVTLYSDWILKTGICEYLVSHSGITTIIGAIGLIITIIKCQQSAHRTFSHSFLGLAFLSGFLALIFPPITPYFAIGFLSHILLDLFNIEPVEIFYPYPSKKQKADGKKGVYFRICASSNPFANRFLTMLGILGTGFFLIHPFISIRLPI